MVLIESPLKSMEVDIWSVDFGWSLKPPHSCLVLYHIFNALYWHLLVKSPTSQFFGKSLKIFQPSSNEKWKHFPDSSCFETAWFLSFLYEIQPEDNPEWQLLIKTSFFFKFPLKLRSDIWHHHTDDWRKWGNQSATTFHVPSDQLFGAKYFICWTSMDPRTEAF